MPRVKPKIRPLADTLDEHKAIQAAHREAAHDFKLARDAALDEVTAKHGIALGRAGKSVYEQPGCEHSYFRDLAALAIEHANQTTRGSEGQLLAQGWDFPHVVHGGPAEARARLATVETRTMSTTATAGGNFVVNVGPRYVADAFSEAARNAAVLTGLLPVEPLPDTGLDVYTARITTGTTVAVQATQNTSLSNTDAVEAKTQTSPVAMVAGYVDLSLQLFERAEPRIADVVLARDMGSALAAQLEAQLLAGTGANGQALGLTAVTGIGTGAYTDASPTQAEAFPTIAKGYADLSVSLGKTAGSPCTREGQHGSVTGKTQRPACSQTCAGPPAWSRCPASRSPAAQARTRTTCSCCAPTSCRSASARCSSRSSRK
jgi:HK97 family phage major capsid protein